MHGRLLIYKTDNVDRQILEPVATWQRSALDYLILEQPVSNAAYPAILWLNCIISPRRAESQINDDDDGKLAQQEGLVESQASLPRCFACDLNLMWSYNVSVTSLAASCSERQLLQALGSACRWDWVMIADRTLPPAGAQPCE